MNKWMNVTLTAALVAVMGNQLHAQEPRSKTTSNASKVRVHLLCADGFTQHDQHVYAVGSGPELGNWKTDQALPLEDASQYPLWQGEVWLVPNRRYEWKCIVRDEKGVVREQKRARNVLVATPEVSSVGVLPPEP